MYICLFYVYYNTNVQQMASVKLKHERGREEKGKEGRKHPQLSKAVTCLKIMISFCTIIYEKFQ